MTETTMAPFRLAFREEGTMWNAYLAKHGTMDSATLIGSIRMSVVVADEAVKEAFMETMQKALAAVVRGTGLGEITFLDPPTPAPESERSGHG